MGAQLLFNASDNGGKDIIADIRRENTDGHRALNVLFSLAEFRHIGAAALPLDQIPLFLQLGHCLPHSLSADLKAPCQLKLSGQALPRAIFPRLDLLPDAGGDHRIFVLSHFVHLRFYPSFFAVQKLFIQISLFQFYSFFQ